MPKHCISRSLAYIPINEYKLREDVLHVKLVEQDIQILKLLRNSLTKLQDAISLPQLVALMCIGEQPGLSVNDLADLMHVPQQTASRYASVLMGRYDSPTTPATSQTKPLVAQGLSEHDPRSRALYLTAAGRDLLVSLTSSFSANPRRL